jgi:hypothetical protein
LIEQVRGFIAAGRTNADISQLIKSTGCNRISDVVPAAECRALADIYIMAIIQLVQGNVDKNVICGLLKICQLQQGASAKAADAPLALGLAAPLPAGITLPPPVAGNQGTDPICDSCKAFFNEIQQLILTNGTEAALELLIDAQLCAKLGILEFDCKTLVSSKLPTLLTSLAAVFDADTICPQLGCCAQVPTGGVPPSSRCTLVSNGETIDYRLLCSTAAYKFDQKSSVTSFIQGDICSGLTSDQSTCNTLTPSFAGYFVEKLVYQTNFGPRCAQLTNNNNVGRPPAAALAGPNALRWNGGSADPGQCKLCLKVTATLSALLKDIVPRMVAGSPLTALNSNMLCNNLPDPTQQATCRNIFQTISPQTMAERLLSGQDQASICMDLGLC